MMYKPGDLVQFQLGLESVKAEVLGISQGNQYVLRLVFDVLGKHGNLYEERRIYYRDRQFIDTLPNTDFVAGSLWYEES